MALKEAIITNVGIINDDKLNEDIRAAIGSVYTGFSRRPKVDGIILLFEQAASDTDISTAQGIVTAHDPNAKTVEQQLRENIIITAQSAVGVTLNDLTLAQVKALFAIVLHKEGAVASDLTIKPLAQWVR